MSPATRSTQYLAFAIAGEEYAVHVLRVKEIIESEHITRIPSLPDWLPGVLNLRGESVPAVDLATKFGLRQQAPVESGCVVVVELEGEGGRSLVGVIADSVSQVVEIEPSAIQPPPVFGTTVDAEDLSGVSLVGEKFLMILNVDRVFTEDEQAEFKNLAPVTPTGAPIS